MCEKLGEGAFGVVMKAMFNDKTVAAKMLKGERKERLWQDRFGWWLRQRCHKIQMYVKWLWMGVLGGE